MKAKIQYANRSASRYEAKVPQIFLDLERQGIDLSRPFTVEVDTYLGIIEAEQKSRAEA